MAKQLDRPERYFQDKFSIWTIEKISTCWPNMLQEEEREKMFGI